MRGGLRFGFFVNARRSIPAIELLGSSIELFSDRIVDADVEAMVDTITSGAVTVDALYLWVNRITDVGASALARLLIVRGQHPLCCCVVPLGCALGWNCLAQRQCCSCF